MAYITKEIKAKPEVIFKLKDLNVEDDYSIWDNNNKTFIKKGMVKTDDGTEYDVQETKFIPKAEFDSLFKGCQKNNKYLREVLIEGELYKYPMPHSVNKQVADIVSTLLVTGQDPLDVTFKQTKTGSGIGTRYEVVLYQEESTQANEVKIDINPISTTTEESPREPLILNDTEKALVEAIKKNGSGFTFDQVKPHFLKYDIDERRARDVWMEELQ